MALAHGAPAGRELRLRQRLASSTTLTLLGVLTSLMLSETLGAWLTVTALAMLLWTIHEIGRLGPDPPREQRPAPTPGRPGDDPSSAAL